MFEDAWQLTYLLSVNISLIFFCFKQKTAYEMRISDWSSDVCSSDLFRRGPGPIFPRFQIDDEATVGEIIACAKAAWGTGDNGAHGAIFQQRQQGILRGHHIAVHLLEAGSFRCADAGIHDEIGRAHL